MKKIILTSLLLFASSTLAQQSGSFGAGLFLGNPSAITIKYWQNQQVAFQGGLTYNFDDYGLFYGDFLMHLPGALQGTPAFMSSLTPYWGVGALIAITTDDRSDEDLYLGDESGDIGFGIRIPLGFEWSAPNIPLGVFLELAPGMSFAPESSGMLNGGIGARYYF